MACVGYPNSNWRYQTVELFQRQRQGEESTQWKKRRPVNSQTSNSRMCFTQRFRDGGTFAHLPTFWTATDGQHNLNLSVTFPSPLNVRIIRLFISRTMVSSLLFILMPTRAHFRENLLCPWGFPPPTVFIIFLVAWIFPPFSPGFRRCFFKIAGYHFLILMHLHEDGTKEEKTSDNQRVREGEGGKWGGKREWMRHSEQSRERRLDESR